MKEAEERSRERAMNEGILLPPPGESFLSAEQQQSGRRKSMSAMPR